MRMQKVVLTLVLCLLPFATRADGKVFAQRTAFAEATIPDQRALLWWSNGVERLAIDTRFAGAGTNFAWVVPLPEPPMIEAASPGMFNTLAYQTRPELIHNPAPLFAVCLFSLGLGWLLLFVRHDDNFVLSDVLASAAAAAGVLYFSVPMGILVLVLLHWGVARVRSGRENVYALLAVIFLAFLLGSMMLPALGKTKAGGIGNTAGDVTELASARVGAYDTTTLTAKNARALLDWLGDNQFQQPTNAEPVIADYLKRGWVFVATKLNRSDSVAATNAVHPLAFTFASPEPVYPLKLTAVGNGPLRVELYVFGTERAEAVGFEAEYCAAVEWPEAGARIRQRESVLPVAQPGLRRFAHGSSIVTKLAARLSPAQMEKDAVVHWRPFALEQKELYSRKGALVTAANWSAGVLLAFAAMAAVRLALRKASAPEWSGGFVALALGASLLTLGVTYVVLPQVPVRLERSPTIFAAHHVQYLGINVLADWAETRPTSLLEARSAVARAVKSTSDNVLLGGKIHEEDSPGNYVIRQDGTNFQFFWFDVAGGEHNVAEHP